MTKQLKGQKANRFTYKGPFKHRTLKKIDTTKSMTKCGFIVSSNECEDNDVSCPECLNVESIERKLIK